MKSLHEKEGKSLFARIKSVKNLEIIIAAVLAFIAIIVYFGVSYGGKGRKSAAESASISADAMTSEEKRLAATISNIEGIGSCTALIKTGADKEVLGVVIVAQGANDMAKKVQVIRCVEIATGATVDKIQVYQMANGG